MSNLEINNTEDLRKEFLRRANKLCKYNCPYVWGGNGEKTNKMLAVALLEMETSVDNIARIYNYMKKNPRLHTPEFLIVVDLFIIYCVSSD